MKAFEEKTQNKVINLGSWVEIANYQGNAITGQVTDLNAWDRPLSTEKVEEWASNCNSSFYQNNPPNVISWLSSKKDLWINGSITSFNVSWNDLCYNAKQAYPQSSIFLVNMDLDKACLHCDALGGQLPIPKSMEDNTKIFINRFTNGKP